MNDTILQFLIWFSPLLIGGIIAVINSESTNNFTEKIEAWFRRTQAFISAKDSWFYKFILNPVFWIVVKFSDWTDSFTHRGIKNGTRVSLTLYLIVGWCFLLYLLFIIAVVLIIAGVIIYVIIRILSGTSQEEAPAARSRSGHKCEDCESIDIKGLGITTKGNGRCRECSGTGHDKLSEAMVQFGTLGIEDGKIDCKFCHGTGQCQTCGGTGLIYY